MKSIDLLFPIQEEKGTQLPENNGNELIEKLSATLLEVVEKQGDNTQSLAESFKTTIAEAMAQGSQPPTGGDDNDDIDKED